MPAPISTGGNDIPVIKKDEQLNIEAIAKMLSTNQITLQDFLEGLFEGIAEGIKDFKKETVDSEKEKTEEVKKQTVKTTQLKKFDDKKFEKDTIEERTFFTDLNEKLGQDLEKAGGKSSKVALDAFLGPMRLLTDPLQDFFGIDLAESVGSSFSNAMKKSKNPNKGSKPTRSEMSKWDRGALYIGDMFRKGKGGEEEDKGALGGLDKLLAGLGIPALGAALSALIPWLAIASGIVMMVLDGIKGWMLAEKWGVSKIAGALGGALGGTGSGIKNAFANAGKWALIGAGIGMKINPIVGTIAGGLIGAAIGFILGWIGGEKIAKFLDSLWAALKKFWAGFVKSFLKTWEANWNIEGILNDDSILPQDKGIEIVRNVVNTIFNSLSEGLAGGLEAVFGPNVFSDAIRNINLVRLGFTDFIFDFLKMFIDTMIKNISKLFGDLSTIWGNEDLSLGEKIGASLKAVLATIFVTISDLIGGTVKLLLDTLGVDAGKSFGDIIVDAIMGLLKFASELIIGFITGGQISLKDIGEALEDFMGGIFDIIDGGLALLGDTAAQNRIDMRKRSKQLREDKKERKAIEKEMSKKPKTEAELKVINAERKQQEVKPMLSKNKMADKKNDLAQQKGMQKAFEQQGNQKATKFLNDINTKVTLPFVKKAGDEIAKGDFKAKIDPNVKINIGETSLPKSTADNIKSTLSSKLGNAANSMSSTLGKKLGGARIESEDVDASRKALKKGVVEGTEGIVLGKNGNEGVAKQLASTPLGDTLDKVRKALGVGVSDGVTGIVNNMDLSSAKVDSESVKKIMEAKVANPLQSLFEAIGKFFSRLTASFGIILKGGIGQTGGALSFMAGGTLTDENDIKAIRKVAGERYAEWAKSSASGLKNPTSFQKWLDNEGQIFAPYLKGSDRNWTADKSENIFTKARGGWSGLQGPEVTLLGEREPEFIIPKSKLQQGLALADLGIGKKGFDNGNISTMRDDIKKSTAGGSESYGKEMLTALNTLIDVMKNKKMDNNTVIQNGTDGKLDLIDLRNKLAYNS